MLQPLTAQVSQQGLRRVSSHSAQRSDLFAGPTVVGPTDDVDSKSGATEMAYAMEMAKQHLAESTTSPTPEASEPGSPQAGNLATVDKYAFAFDIDGVLIKGGQVIPEAIQAMKVLNGDNEYGIKVYGLA
jgi:hypothetical protein